MAAGVFGVAVYIGYFGAAGGIVMLALLIAMVAEPLARTNAVKNILGAVANTVAAVAFAVFGHVDWAAVVPLAAGFLIGGWTGPALVRRIPGQVLRIGSPSAGWWSRSSSASPPTADPAPPAARRGSGPGRG